MQAQDLAEIARSDLWTALAGSGFERRHGSNPSMAGRASIGGMGAGFRKLLRGKGHGDRGAFARHAGDVEMAAVQIDHRLGERQAEAGPLVGARKRRGRLAETLERDL